jgi:hypothetical protein
VPHTHTHTGVGSDRTRPLDRRAAFSSGPPAAGPDCRRRPKRKARRPPSDTSRLQRGRRPPETMRVSNSAVLCGVAAAGAVAGSGLEAVRLYLSPPRPLQGGARVQEGTDNAEGESSGSGALVVTRVPWWDRWAWFGIDLLRDRWACIYPPSSKCQALLGQVATNSPVVLCGLAVGAKAGWELQPVLADGYRFLFPRMRLFFTTIVQALGYGRLDLAQEVLDTKLEDFRTSFEQDLASFRTIVERKFGDQQLRIDARHADVRGVLSELAGVDHRVHRLEGKMDDLKSQLAYTDQGINLLSNVLAERLGSQNSKSTKERIEGKI